MDGQGNKKRFRDEGVKDGETDAVAIKRLRDNLQFILDDVDGDEEVHDELFQVMKSFEEEISAPSTPSHALQKSVVVDLTNDCSESRRPELGYLLEASDDELGLPPIAVIENPLEESVTAEENAESVSNSIDSLRPLDIHDGDGFPSYDELEFGLYEYQDCPPGRLDFGNNVSDYYAEAPFDVPEIFDGSWWMSSMPSD